MMEAAAARSDPTYKDMSRERSVWSVEMEQESCGAHGPGGATSSRTTAVELERFAGRPSLTSGSIVGSFIRAPQEKPFIGSTS